MPSDAFAYAGQADTHREGTGSTQLGDLGASAVSVAVLPGFHVCVVLRLGERLAMGSYGTQGSWVLIERSVLSY